MITSPTTRATMKQPTRPTYFPAFGLEVTQQVVDKARSVGNVSESLGLGKSSVDKWVRQLKQ